MIHSQTAKLSYHLTDAGKMVYHFRGLTKMVLCTLHLALCTTILLTSCRPTNAPEGDASETKLGERVTFYTSLLSIDRDSTFTDSSPHQSAAAYHAVADAADTPADISLEQASMTDLWVFEGSTLLAHQHTGDADFGTPSVELSYGSHTITFVASSQSGQTFTSGTWHADKANDCFGSVESVDVSSSTSAQAVILMRCTYGLKWQSTDLVPTGTKTLRLSISPMRESLTSGLHATDGYTRTYTYDVTSYVGRVISVTVYGLPENYGVEDEVTTTIDFLDAADHVVFTHTRTVPVLSNRRTIITGALFNSSASTPIRINSQWLDDYETSL